jgi:hypothetical protein
MTMMAADSGTTRSQLKQACAYPAAFLPSLIISPHDGACHHLYKVMRPVSHLDEAPQLCLHNHIYRVHKARLRSIPRLGQRRRKHYTEPQTSPECIKRMLHIAYATRIQAGNYKAEAFAST